jgi:hypothetical protein
MDLMFFGIEIKNKDSQNPNAPSPIDSRFSGNTSEVNDLHLKNACLPMDVILSGKVIETTWLHPQSV